LDACCDSFKSSTSAVNGFPIGLWEGKMAVFQAFVVLHKWVDFMLIAADLWFSRHLEFNFLFVIL
jgi:hypothetical protein